MNVPEANPARPVWPGWLPPALLFCAAAILACHAMVYNFICDDAYISLRYAHNLAYHNELVFNLGERVEGYTNFLWTLLLGLLLKLGLDPEITARVLGILCGVLVLVLVCRMTRIYRGGRENGWDYFAPFLLSATAGFAVWCSGGLETQLFCALLLGGMYFYLCSWARPRLLGLSAGLFALATLARPEGLMVFGLSSFHHYLRKVAIERQLLPRVTAWLALLTFVLPVGLFFWWRYRYYGYPLPNTFYVKASAGWAMAKRWGLPYLWDFVRDNHLYALVVLLPLFRPRVTSAISASRHGAERGLSPGFFWSYLGLITLGYLGYVTYVGGDFMALGRFFVPVLPLIAIFVQEGLRESLERFPRRLDADAWRYRRMLATLILVIGACAANSILLYRQNQKMSYRRPGLDTVAYLKKFASDRIEIGEWMRRHLPKDTYLAVGGAGATVYASRLRALDAFGLNDAWIAHNVPASSTRPGHSKYAPESYVLQKGPDLLCHIGKHQDWPHHPSTQEARHWRGKGYRWACINPKNARPRYYCCLKRIDRDLGPYLIEPDER